MRNDNNHLEISGKNPKLSVGPVRFKPGPILLTAVIAEPIAVSKSKPNIISKYVEAPSINTYSTKNPSTS